MRMSTQVISTRVKVAIAVWLIAEMLVFSLVVQWIGAVDAVLIGVITSLLGFSLLRRAGSAALAKLRAGLDRGPTAVGGRQLFLDETLATIGAVALLVPGFLSDIVGLALASSALRDRIAGFMHRRRARDPSTGWTTAARMDRAPPRSGPSIIDLAPEDWRQTDPSARPVSDP